MGIKRALLQATPYLPQVLRDRMVPRENQWTRADDQGYVRSSGAEKMLLIGPTNTAGQGKRWADAAKLIPGADATSLKAVRYAGARTFPVDVTTSLNAMRHSPSWSKHQSEELLNGFTHVMYDSVIPQMGTLYGRDLEREIAALQERGIKVALIWYGTDIRNPSKHRARFADSPFWEDLDGLTERLEQSTTEHSELADRLGVTEFSSGPDLNLYRPENIWLPTLHDSALWSTGHAMKKPKVDAAAKPVVVHIPSLASLKGTARIREAVEPLQDIIDYRELQGLKPEEMVEQVANADILIDQVGMGVFGVASLEGMSLGIPTIAEAGDMRTGIEKKIGYELPLIEASRSTLTDILRDLAADPDRREEIGQRSMEYVAAVHSPENVARVLAENFFND